MPKKKILFSVFMFLLLLTACNNAKDEELDGTVYTSKDVYIDSFECGYLPAFPKDCAVIVETQDQLDHVKNYGIEELLTKLEKQYSINEYTYIIQYDMMPNTSYYLHADRIVMDSSGPYFLMDSKSYGPKSGERVSPAIRGFMHIAAVPKAYLEDYTFTNPYIIYPGEEQIQEKTK